MKTQNVNDVEAVTDVKILFNACEHANTFGALNMNNSNVNVVNGVYRKEYTHGDEIREFELIVHGELDEKLKEIIEYYKESENLSEIDIVEIVLIFAIVRCYKFNYISVKSYLFKHSELFRDIDIYSDLIDVVEDKKHLINVDDIKYKDFWIKTECINSEKERKLKVFSSRIDGILSISLNVVGQLLEHTEDCMSVYNQDFGWNTEESLERMVRVGINRVHDLLIECCDIDELLENDIFAYDHE